jgi:hypothetical protein
LDTALGYRGRVPTRNIHNFRKPAESGTRYHAEIK